MPGPRRHVLLAIAELRQTAHGRAARAFAAMIRAAMAHVAITFAVMGLAATVHVAQAQIVEAA